ncbi:MAG: hypothetical protein WDN28_10105 [Chthoniobacter sp.]
MNIRQISLAVIVLTLATACADTSPTRVHQRVSASDDRQLNSQSHNFETADQPTGLDVTRPTAPR